MAIELGNAKFWERLESDPKKLAMEVCLIDISNMNAALQKHAALRAWVNAAHESARIEEEQADYALTKAKATALLKAKEAKDKHTEKPKTVEVLKAETELDDAVIAAQSEYFIYARKRGALRAMSQALEDRLQMLIQLSANQRKEIEDSSRR